MLHQTHTKKFRFFRSENALNYTNNSNNAWVWPS